MEQGEKPLPIEDRTLADLAVRCHAYPKALHYKENEFRKSPAESIEALIGICNQLQQPEAALGILECVELAAAAAAIVDSFRHHACGTISASRPASPPPPHLRP
jgi:hypothetical protein